MAKRTPGWGFFGKVRIPTTGHRAAIDQAKQIATQNGAMLHVALSGTSHPLSQSQKAQQAKAVFQHPVELQHKNIIDFLGNMSKTHDDFTLVCGSDRANEYRQILARYNGKQDQSGKTPFSFKNWRVYELARKRVESNKPATQMTPYELVRSASASKMEHLARKNNWAEFRAYHPHMSESQTRKLFDQIRKGLALKESKIDNAFTMMINEQSKKEVDTATTTASHWSTPAGFGTMLTGTRNMMRPNAMARTVLMGMESGTATIQLRELITSPSACTSEWIAPWRAPIARRCSTSSRFRVSRGSWNSGLSVLRHGDTNRHVLLRRFARSPGAVLFATDSFWEGMDVRGEALRCVIITRLPFRVPTEPIEQARVEAITERGGNAFAEQTVPQAVIKLKQGFGRLIRARADRGAVDLLDSRVVHKQYGRIFLQSLPPARQLIAPRQTVYAELRRFFAGQAA